jgi:hypothetical protein
MKNLVLIILLVCSTACLAEDLPFDQTFAQNYQETSGTGVITGIKIPPNLAPDVTDNIDRLYFWTDIAEKTLGEKYGFVDTGDGIVFDKDAGIMNLRLINDMKSQCPDIRSRMKAEMLKDGLVSSGEADTILDGFLNAHNTIFDQKSNDALYNALANAEIWKVGENEYISLRNLAYEHASGISGSRIDEVGNFKTSLTTVPDGPLSSEAGLMTTGSYSHISEIEMKLKISTSGKVTYLAETVQAILHEFTHYSDHKLFGADYTSAIKTVKEGLAADSSIASIKKLEDGFYKDSGFDYERLLISKNRLRTALNPRIGAYFGGGTIMNTLRKRYGDSVFASEIRPKLMKAGTMDEFLRILSDLPVAAIRVFRITESTVEVLQADGTTKTYNSHEEFMAAPEAERTIGGQRINLVDNEMEIAGETIHIGPNIYYEGVPEPGTSRLVQDPTVIEEVVIREFSDGTVHYDLHVTHTDVDGSVYRARVRTDASGTVIETEILDGTRLSKVARFKSVISGLRNSRVLRAASTGAEYAGVFGHGLILAIAINGIYYGDWKWVAPELATSVATGIMVKVGATALRANLIGTIIGSIFELGIYSWEERDANEIKQEFGIDQTSTWDTVKGGLKRMADSYWNLLAIFGSPQHGYGKALEDKILGDMDTYLAKNYQAKGITPAQIQQLKEQLMRNGQYSQRYHEQMILPIEGALFNTGPLYDQYKIYGNPEDVAKELNKRMCVLLQDWQEDKELQKVGVYLDEKSFRHEVMNAEFYWWKTQLVGAQNELQKSKKLKTTPDPKTNGIGIDRIEESTSGDTIIVDDYWTGKGSVPFFIDADKAIGFIDGVQKSLEGMNCEDIAKDLQYRVFVKNNFEEPVECDKGTNKATLKWEIKSGTDCDKDEGYEDITSRICGETAPLLVPVGSDVEAFCTSKDKDHLIKDLYPEKNGPWCVRVTWCGQPEVFKYGGKK